MKELAIIISVFNEEGNLTVLFNEIFRNCPVEKANVEIIFVNDGSTDRSTDLIDDLCRKNSGVVKAVHLSRNFGHEAAMIAGIDMAQAKAIICMDADLQHPPEKIPEIFGMFSEGNEIVLMQRLNERKKVKGFLSRFFYRHLSRQNSGKYYHNVSDFFLISEKIATILRSEFRERNRFLRGFIQSMGFKYSVVQYSAPIRHSGSSKYSGRKLMKYSLNSLMANSNFPLLISWYLGIIMMLFSIAVGVYSLVMYFVEKPVSGYTTIVVLISFIAAVQFLILGIMGRYIAFVFDEVKKRPVYIINRLENFNP